MQQGIVEAQFTDFIVDAFIISPLTLALQFLHNFVFVEV